MNILTHARENMYRHMYPYRYRCIDAQTHTYKLNVTVVTTLLPLKKIRRGKYVERFESIDTQNVRKKKQEEKEREYERYVRERENMKENMKDNSKKGKRKNMRENIRELMIDQQLCQTS